MESKGEKNLPVSSPLLEKMIKEGNLGKKTGGQFYRDSSDGQRLPFKDKK